jgi:hypothetical protein
MRVGVGAIRSQALPTYLRHGQAVESPQFVSPLTIPFFFDSSFVAHFARYITGEPCYVVLSSLPVALFPYYLRTCIPSRSPMMMSSTTRCNSLMQEVTMSKQLAATTSRDRFRTMGSCA